MEYALTYHSMPGWPGEHLEGEVQLEKEHLKRLSLETVEAQVGLHSSS